MRSLPLLSPPVMSRSAPQRCPGPGSCAFARPIEFAGHDRIWIVGDNLETDIGLAVNIGAPSTFI
jgi:ribonucleotide monophosphatase NagD (HAD superfamily)